MRKALFLNRHCTLLPSNMAAARRKYPENIPCAGLLYIRIYLPVGGSWSRDQVEVAQWQPKQFILALPPGGAWLRGNCDYLQPSFIPYNLSNTSGSQTRFITLCTCQRAAHSIFLIKHLAIVIHSRNIELSIFCAQFNHTLYPSTRTHTHTHTHTASDGLAARLGLAAITCMNRSHVFIRHDSKYNAND